MKKTTLVSLLLVVFIFSCEKDSLDNVSDIRERIIGQWSVQEDSELLKSINTSYYTVNISSSEIDSSVVLIDNFYQAGLGIAAEGEIRDGKIVLISNQEIANNYGSFTIISGTGSISNNYSEISWTYSIDDGLGNIDNVEAIYTKQ